MTCWLKAQGLVDTECDWIQDWCHFVPKQTLRNAGDHAHLTDGRNLRRLCRRHHHQMDSGSVSLHLAQLPASVREFAFELNYRYEPGKPMLSAWRKQVLVP